MNSIQFFLFLFLFLFFSFLFNFFFFEVLTKAQSKNLRGLEMGRPVGVFILDAREVVVPMRRHLSKRKRKENQKRMNEQDD
jgi:hypothetical protein